MTNITGIQINSMLQTIILIILLYQMLGAIAMFLITCRPDKTTIYKSLTFAKALVGNDFVFYIKLIATLPLTIPYSIKKIFKI